MGKIQASELSTTQLLSELPLGGRARVAEVRSDGFEARRLEEYGLTAGTPITALFRSLGGNLTAFEIRGAVIALRRDTSGKIEIETCK